VSTPYFLACIPLGGPCSVLTPVFPIGHYSLATGDRVHIRILAKVLASFLDGLRRQELEEARAGLMLSFVLFAVLDELLGLLTPDKFLNVAFAVVATGTLIGLVAEPPGGW
jgi:hypothetical protein